tara:strand:+ start:2541 stop:2864 length:324 start_codon:yes stop_codon:yes gene_type:complete
MSDTISKKSESTNSLDELDFNLLYPDSRSSSVCDDYTINSITSDDLNVEQKEIIKRKREVNFSDNMTISEEPKRFTPTPSKYYIMLQENYNIVNKLKKVLDNRNDHT